MTGLPVVEFYDSLGSAVQLGGDLQTGSSNGWPFPNDDFDTHFDGQSLGGNGVYGNPVLPPVYSPNLVDMCLHQGELHVAWVEPIWNGANRMQLGPYVKKWNGTSWVALGATVDAGVTPIAVSLSPVVSGVAGTYGVPARPSIVSDGTNLWVAYTVRQVATANNPPPNGTHIQGQPCGCYVGSCDLTDYSKWAARKVIVRKWNGASWDLFGDLAASTNNCLAANEAINGTGTPALVSLQAWASPSAPGDVYVAFYEAGQNTSFPGWLVDVFCFIIQFGSYYYAPQRERLNVALFNTGTGTAGTVKTIGSYDFPGGTTYSGYVATGINPQGIAFGGNENGPVVFAVDAAAVGVPLKMIDWTTQAVLQSLPGGSFSGSSVFGPDALGHDANGRYYLQGSANVIEVPDDGSGPLVPLDYADYGTAQWYPFGEVAVSFSNRIAADMGNGNLWITARRGNVLLSSSRVYIQYHHNCPDWEQYDTWPGTENVLPVGQTVPVLDGDTLYAAGAFRASGGDVKVKVFEMPITRNSGSCGGDLTGFPSINTYFPIGAPA